MKVSKYLFVLAMAFFVLASNSNAQASVQFLGGGSSALFLELGQSAVTLVGSGACIWSSNALSDNNIAAQDNRTASPTLETGKIWVVWSAGSGTCASPAGSFNIYSYMSLDSVIGDRC